MINHIGIIYDKNIIISKWSWGTLLKHKILEVPESYGSDISYVKAIKRERALDLYKKYKAFNLK